MTLKKATTKELLDELRKREGINPSLIKLTNLLFKVAEIHNVTVADLRGSGQLSSWTHPRHQYCVYAARNTSASQKAIAAVINKDGSVVRRALEEHENKMLIPAYENTWRELLEEMK